MLHVQRVATLGADDSNLNETLFGNEILRLFTPTAAVSPSFLDKFCKVFVNLFSSYAMLTAAISQKTNETQIIF